MSTIQQLASSGDLVKIKGVLRHDEMEERLIYGTKDFVRWLGGVLPTIQKDRHSYLTPQAQVRTIFRHFINGNELTEDKEIKLLRPIGKYAWEIRPLDIRIFGYFYRKNVFIAVAGESKKNLRNNKNYAPFINEVQRVMSAIDLNPPKCMTESNLDELV